MDTTEIVIEQLGKDGEVFRTFRRNVAAAAVDVEIHHIEQSFYMPRTRITVNRPRPDGNCAQPWVNYPADEIDRAIGLG